MTAITSATGGPIQPNAQPAVLEGEQLEDFFHDEILVPLTGLDPTMVRPAWQSEPPNIPKGQTTWLAFHLVDIDSDAFPFAGPLKINEVTNPDGTIQLQNNEEFNLVCSFYSTGTQAPSQARALCKLLRDNLAISQNREPLFVNGMGLVRVPAAGNPAPVLIKERWLYRIDMTIRIRRNVVRNYQILSLNAADGTVTIQLEQGANKITRTLEIEQETT